MKPASALSGWFAFPCFAQGTFTKTREPSRALVSQETPLFPLRTLSKFLTPSGLWGNLLSHGSYSKHPNFRRMDVFVGSPLQGVG